MAFHRLGMSLRFVIAHDIDSGEEFWPFEPGYLNIVVDCRAAVSKRGNGRDVELVQVLMPY